MRKPVLFFFLLFVLSATTSLFSQVENKAWLASFNTFKLKNSKKLSIHFDAQWRSTDQVKGMQTLLLRAGLNHKTTDHLTLTGGYAFISNRRTVSTVTGFTPEHRIWQQAIVSHKLKKISIAHRFRTEQRFIGQSRVSGNELVTEGSRFAGRFRYFIRNVLPVSAKENFDKGLFAALQNELFLNVINQDAANGKTFDQNRLYLALGYKFNSSFSIDGGYLNHYVNGRNNSFGNNHIAQLAFYTQL